MGRQKARGLELSFKPAKGGRGRGRWYKKIKGHAIYFGWGDGVTDRVGYLPPYSPDFNPIENMWSKVKACLRKAGARTFDALVDAARDALLAVTPEDCDGYFEHCGYGEQPT